MDTNYVVFPVDIFMAVQYCERFSVMEMECAFTFAAFLFAIVVA